MKILITGGCGFIGSNFVHSWLNNHPNDQVINLDKVTYAGHVESLKDVQENPNYKFVKGDICDPDIVEQAMFGVDVVIHFAAESHVDRSIIDPMAFIKTNVLGTGVLLNQAKKNKVKRFHHISTDEVFGELGFNDPPFNEETKFKPRTPYSASKAGSDHLVKAYFESYGLPITISNCANNYGPFHDPEKLIPRFVTNLLEGKKVPLMGQGENIRSWVYVEDHNRGVEVILEKGVVGETYCIGGEEKTNKEVTLEILKILGLGEEQIEYVEHRLGHDLRYALDDSKLKSLGWERQVSFEDGIKRTIQWFKENEWWWKDLKIGRPDIDRTAQEREKHNGGQ